MGRKRNIPAVDQVERDANGPGDGESERDANDPGDGESERDANDPGDENAPLEAPAREHMIGRVAVVGYPNVGKSTLVNRLSGTRQAIVHETPGVTRDRKEVTCEWNGALLVLIDTGGVDAGDPRPMQRQIVEQARMAIAEADLVLLVVDAAQGVSAADFELAQILRESRTDTIVVANKLDNPRRENEAAEFFQLGLGEPIPVSAHHGNNTGDLLDDIVERLRDHGTPFDQAIDNTTIRVAVLGRPNVGKSTLVNAMLGSDRVIVSEVAGTTRDSIDTHLAYDGRTIVLVDTAGIRRRAGKSREPVEFYGEVRSMQAAERANVALVLVDASQGVKEADVMIADQARQRDCATIVCLSKWDINDVDLDDVQKTLLQKLRQRPEVITTSGVTRRNIIKVLDHIVELHGRYSHRIGTGELNRFLAEIKQQLTPPADKRSRRRLNLLYGTQYQVAPARFRIFVNDRKLVTRNYGFFVENRIREKFQLEGCPLIIDYQDRT